MSLLQTVRLVAAAPHPAGRPFLAVAAAVAVLGAFVSPWLLALGALAALACWGFFRDPERVPPNRPGIVLAAADGRVVSVAEVRPPPELGLGATPCWRVGTFLSILDVHVNRVPAAGTVTRITYRPGRFVNASLDKASEQNERNAVAIRLDDGRALAVVQIAGLIARRIVCQLREGEVVKPGQRFGIIRFGSRTDLYLPVGVAPLVCEGQTMVGGETVVAELGPRVIERAKGL